MNPDPIRDALTQIEKGHAALYSYLLEAAKSVNGQIDNNLAHAESSLSEALFILNRWLELQKAADEPQVYPF